MSQQPKYRHGGPVPDDEPAADESRTLPSVHDRLPVVGGLLTGAGAFLVTYLFAALIAFTTRKRSSPWDQADSAPHVLTEASWTVLINLGGGLHQGGELIETEILRYGMLRFASSPTFTLLVLGIVIGAGYAVASCVRTDSTMERVGSSLLVVPAYIVFAAILAVLSTWNPSTDGRRVPDGQEIAIPLVDAVIYAGVLIPAVLALLGGLLCVGHRTWIANRDPQ